MASQRLTITILELAQAFAQLPPDGQGRRSHRIALSTLRPDAPVDNNPDPQVEFIWDLKQKNWRLLGFNVDVISTT